MSDRNHPHAPGPAAGGESADAPVTPFWTRPLTLLYAGFAVLIAGLVVWQSTHPPRPVSAELDRALAGHGSPVNSVEFSPDGAMLASAGDDGTARLWDTATGREVAALTGHSGRVFDVTFSPDGDVLATGGDDGTARLWDTGDWEEVTTLTVAEGPPSGVGPDTHRVDSVAFSADGAMLATGAHDTVQLWDTGTGEEITALDGGRAAFSPEGTALAAVDADGTGARVLETRTWDRIAAVDADAVNSVEFSPDGTLLATTSAQHGPRSESDTARVWDADSGRLVTTLSDREDFEVAAVAFAPDGRTLAAASSYAAGRHRFAVRLVDTGTWQEITTLTGDDSWVRAVAFGPDGTAVATASGGLMSGTAMLWDVGGHVGGP